MTREHLFNIALMVITSLLASALIMPFMMKIAHHIGAVDVPRTTEGNRHIHKKPIPKLGGVGIFLGFLVGYMIFGIKSTQMNAVLIGAFIIILTGLIDDINDIKPKYKMLGQIITACVVTFYGNILLSSTTVFGLPEIHFGLFAYPITIFFIITCINIINLIDGLDGLSGGISAIFFLAVGIICILQQRVETLELILSFIMLGSTIGFLIHNFNPAKIFAGDCSQFLGYMIAIISLLGFKGTAFTSIFIPLLIIAIPIMDTLFAIIRRKLNHKSIFSADKEHLHHQLLRMTSSQKKTVLIIYVLDGLFAIASILVTMGYVLIGEILYILLAIFLIWLVNNTNIITDKGLLHKFRSKIK